MLPAQPNQSLIDGLATLQAVAAAPEPVGTRALARQLGLDPTRANRLLKTLAHLGLTRRSLDGRYGAGPAIHVLAAQSLRASGLIRRSLKPLQELGRFDAIVAMGVLWRDEVCYIYFAPPGADIDQALGSRDPHPATTSGLGLALLAELSEADVRARFRGRPTPGFADPNELLRALGGMRRQGYALSAFGRLRGHATVAVSLGDPAYAAIGLAGKIDRRKERSYARALRETAAAIEPANASAA